MYIRSKNGSKGDFLVPRTGDRARDTTNKSRIPPAVYIHSGRESCSEIHTETRLGKRSSNDIHLSPASQLEHADAAGTFEYVPTQHRHVSVDRHQAVRAAVLHQMPSAARHHAHMLHLSSTPPFDAHTLVGQEGTSRGIQQTTGHHITTQSNEPPILPAVYIYSGRVSSSALRTERLDWVRGHHMPLFGIQLSPAPQLTQAASPVAPTTIENLPAHNTDMHQQTDTSRLV